MKKTILYLLIITFGFSYAQDEQFNSEVSDSIFFLDDPSVLALDNLWSQMQFVPADTKFKDSIDLGNPEFADSIYEQRMEVLNANSPMNLIYNDVVRRYIDLYTERRRNQVSRMMGLAEYYFPMFEATLDKYDMPLELKYLAIIESALNPQATSRVGAKGLWQFMYGTAKISGLHVSSYVDDRFDPIKSTEAACRYMTKMYDIYGDWNLVLAAYNSGPGNVNKAIRRSGGKRDYWELRNYLPRETAGYVPAFIAVNYVMNYAPEHNLYPEPYYFLHHQVDTVKTREMISLEQISRLTNTGMDELEFLNPQYKYGIIPKVKGKEYFVVLPITAAGVFVSNEDSIYTIAVAEMEAAKSTLPEYIDGEQRKIHRVSSGENLSLIASRYHVRVSEIKKWNHLRSDMIRVGQKLVIYPRNYNPDKTQTAQKEPAKEVVKPEGKPSEYVVQSGDTLYDIAKNYSGVSAEQIESWNSIKGSQIKPGMKLVIYTGN